MTEMTEEQELAQFELAMDQFEIIGVKPTLLDSGYSMFDELDFKKKVGNSLAVSTTFTVFDGEPNNASELVFDALIGDTGLCRQFEESPIGSSFFWTPLEASRLLSGIEPVNYPEGANSVIGSRRSGAVENATENADSAYRKMKKTELGKCTPWEWLDWADEAHVEARVNDGHHYFIRQLIASAHILLQTPQGRHHLIENGDAAGCKKSQCIR